MLTKISLAGIQGKLSRSEMKKIMAGSGGRCGDRCTDPATDCTGDQNYTCNKCISKNGGPYVCSS